MKRDAQNAFEQKNYEINNKYYQPPSSRRFKLWDDLKGLQDENNDFTVKIYDVSSYDENPNIPVRYFRGIVVFRENGTYSDEWIPLDRYSGVEKIDYNEESIYVYTKEYTYKFDRTGMPKKKVYAIFRENDFYRKNLYKILFKGTVSFSDKYGINIKREIGEYFLPENFQKIEINSIIFERGSEIPEEIDEILSIPKGSIIFTDTAVLKKYPSLSDGNEIIHLEEKSDIDLFERDLVSILKEEHGTYMHGKIGISNTIMVYKPERLNDHRESINYDGDMLDLINDILIRNFNRKVEKITSDISDFDSYRYCIITDRHSWSEEINEQFDGAVRLPLLENEFIKNKKNSNDLWKQVIEEFKKIIK